MNPTTRPGRRLAGLAGLVLAVVLLVAGKAAMAPPTRHVVLAPAPANGAIPASPGATAPSGAGPTAGAGAPATTGGVPASAARRIVGCVVDTEYGPVQVAVVIRGGRIIDVQALRLPSADSRSQEIAAYAAPQLRQEVLAAQSPHIDTVSGASYTSDGYARSVQSALDRARR
jgi:hypothetical protein